MHGHPRPSVCLPGCGRSPALIIGNLFLLVDCTEESFPCIQICESHKAGLSTFHFITGQAIDSFLPGGVAPIIVFYLSLRSQFTCASVPSVERDRGRKDENAPAFHFHSPSINDLTRENAESNMNLAPLPCSPSVFFFLALRHMIQYVEVRREFDGKLWCRAEKNGMKAGRGKGIGLREIN